MTTPTNPAGLTTETLEHGKRPELIAYLKAVDAYTGHSRDGLPELRDHALATFRRLRYANRPAEAGNLEVPSDDERLADQRPVPEQAPAPVPNPDTDPAWADAVAKADEAPVASDDRMERLTLAKAEHVALQAWVAGGKVGDRPATVNLDAMNADYAAGTRSTRKASKGKGRQVAPRRAEANAIAAKGKRGAGRRVTDAELNLYVATVQAEHPQATRNDELEYAYWVQGLAVTRSRWNAAWATVAAGDTPAD
jgi:hypothetical protein